MRNLSNLDRLFKLKQEAAKINKEIATKNETLKAQRDSLVEENVANFIDELIVLSKYGCARYTGITLDFYKSSFGSPTELIHNVVGNHITLKANPSGYSGCVTVYDSDTGWDWYEQDCKKFIARNKNRILDAIEQKIAKSMERAIENANVANKNAALKEDIEILKANGQANCKKQTLKLAQTTIDRVNRILTMTGKELYVKYGYKRDETLCWTVDFGDGIQADIKVVICDEDETPYSECILFDHSSEVVCSDCGDKLDDEWTFEYNGDTYTITVESLG